MLCPRFLLTLATFAVSMAGVKRWRCTSEISKYTDSFCQIHGTKPGCVYVNIEFYSCAGMCNDAIHGSLQDEGRCNRYCPDYYSLLGGCTLQEETTTQVTTTSSSLSTQTTIMPSVKDIGTSTTTDKPNDVPVLGIVLGVVLALLIVFVVVLAICLCRNGRRHFKRLFGCLPCQQPKRAAEGQLESRGHSSDAEGQPDPQGHSSAAEGQPDPQGHSSAVVSNQTRPRQETGLDGICGDTNAYEHHRPNSPSANNYFETTFTSAESRDVNLNASRSTRGNHQPQNDDSGEAAADLLGDPRQHADDQHLQSNADGSPLLDSDTQTHHDQDSPST